MLCPKETNKKFQIVTEKLAKSTVNFRAAIKFLFNLLDNNSICRITERNTITRYTTFILGNPHGGENPTKTSLI
jgi:hypothetical protein